jgi:hypothetical protein
MPFAGSLPEALAALDTLWGLGAGPDDELILADNCGVAPQRAGVLVIRAEGERSPAHARNIGAEHARCQWVLFLDADCRAGPGLIDAYFDDSIERDVGALAGEVIPAADCVSLAGRYGAARSFLDQSRHLAHPYLPRAVAANLLVRREAFAQVGGFYEGVRAAEDTDFSWRLQRAGWRLAARPQARVEHRYRTTIGALRRQWRGYAAGRAWLGRRYEDFSPEPAWRRVAARVLRRRGVSPARPTAPQGSSGARRDRGRFLALDALLGFEELAGLALSNRPAHGGARSGPVRVVLVAGRFPALGDPLADFARTLTLARVEATARPEAVDQRVVRELGVDYREDDGAAARAGALTRVLVRHPIRSTLDLIRRAPGDPSLAALAPAVLRLSREPGARVHPLGGNGATAAARRLAALAGRPLERGGP